MASSINVFGLNLSGVDIKPYSRSQPNLSWNPISNLAIISKHNKSRLVIRKRNSLTVYASNGPELPLPSTPPPSGSGSFKGWIIGIFMSFILPFLGSKRGALWEIKNRVENAVQTVENIAEAVEKVAEEVDKMAEDVGDKLPAGKLKDLMDSIEEVAEKTAKTADSLDDIIDKVQETQDELEDVVESVAKEKAKSPNKPKNQ